MSDPVRIDPERGLAEAADLLRRLIRGVEALGRIRDEEIEIATAAKEEVFRQDKTVLYRYRPTREPAIAVPALLVYGLIGRYTMADLQEDRSLIRNLLGLGVDLYAVDWGRPNRADRWLTIDDYVEQYLADCASFICRRHELPAINLIGICEGGVFTACYAALNPEMVKTLVLTITPIDFHGDMIEGRIEHGFINLWTRSLAAEDIDRMIELWGTLPGEFMSAVFSMMTPMRSITKYNLDLLDLVDDENKLRNFLRMEKWLADRPHHPGEAAKQWLKDLYQQNKLIKNELVLGGRRVDLQNISMPVLNIYAVDDHIIPPACARALKGVVGSRDYSELAVPGGHIGIFVSGKSQGVVAAEIVKWLTARQ